MSEYIQSLIACESESNHTLLAKQGVDEGIDEIVDNGIDECIGEDMKEIIDVRHDVNTDSHSL